MRRNTSPVTESVKKNVRNYLEENNLGKLVEVRRASDHPDDHYLYHVIAKKGNKFSCWTSWNETTQSMNFGHYGLDSYEEAVVVCREFFYEMKM